MTSRAVSTARGGIFRCRFAVFSCRFYSFLFSGTKGRRDLIAAPLRVNLYSCRINDGVIGNAVIDCWRDVNRVHLLGRVLDCRRYNGFRFYIYIYFSIENDNFDEFIWRRMCERKCDTFNAHFITRPHS